MRNASPIAWLPVAHAVTTEEFGPLAPKRIETRPAAMFTISIGMMNGDTRSGPFVFRTSSPSSSVVIPPIPEPINTPNRSASIFPGSRLASATAMDDAAMAYCKYGSRRRASFLSTYASGSKWRTSPAIRVG